MKVPTIRYYARLDYSLDSKKTAKYIITKSKGDYPPMNELIGRDGKISMYLEQKIWGGTTAPPYRLQAKNNLNFTGLKDYYEDGELSGYAYGSPLDKETYSAKKRVNPFYEYKNDGFLFIVHQDDNAQTGEERNKPSYIELLVLDGASQFISRYCKMLIMGGFEEELEVFRREAT